MEDDIVKAERKYLDLRDKFIEFVKLVTERLPEESQRFGSQTDRHTSDDLDTIIQLCLDRVEISTEKQVSLHKNNVKTPIPFEEYSASKKIM